MCLQFTATYIYSNVIHMHLLCELCMATYNIFNSIVSEAPQYENDNLNDASVSICI